MGKKLDGMRTFPHSNSKRAMLNRDREDRAEALEYTTHYPQLRHGRTGAGECPDVYDDVFVYSKWPTKPKENDHKGKATIRRQQIPEPESDDDDSDT